MVHFFLHNSRQHAPHSARRPQRAHSRVELGSTQRRGRGQERFSCLRPLAGGLAVRSSTPAERSLGRSSPVVERATEVRDDLADAEAEARLECESRATSGPLDVKRCPRKGEKCVLPLRYPLCRSACSRPCKVPALTPQHVSSNAKGTPPATGSPDGCSRPLHESTPLPMVSSRE